MQHNSVNLTRGESLGSFVMDDIFLHAKIAADRLLAEVDRLRQHVRGTHDAHLVEPWLAAQKLAARFEAEENSMRMQRDLKKIQEHVERMYTEQRQQLFTTAQARHCKSKFFTDLSIETRQDKLRALSKKFASSPRVDEVLMDADTLARLRASYAYFHDAKQSRNAWTRFPWNVAMRELCAIKAKALGPSKTVMSDFYERFYLKSTKR